MSTQCCFNAGTLAQHWNNTAPESLSRWDFSPCHQWVSTLIQRTAACDRLFWRRRPPTTVIPDVLTFSRGYVYKTRSFSRPRVKSNMTWVSIKKTISSLCSPTFSVNYWMIIYYIIWNVAYTNTSSGIRDQTSHFSILFDAVMGD